ncbi:MAG: hypothetical protein BEU04_02325 [Marine Group III euryarchaeote CG-Bathy1]|uniref:N-acetyltransferase domain-containing protein n=1 Tax=Marine Group III euryarchaeote CG-Bathy1 TaxID=1889001 RepID=A0A1J5T4X4_9ARCH|nr:MAG: hypothetical protein BEU04_02325 [Marine Group III euryarchaeote CG-Bathy1]
MQYILFQPEMLDDVIAFLDKNITERYSPQIFSKIHNLWPEGFIIGTINNEIKSLICGAIVSHSKKLRILLVVVSSEYRLQGYGKQLMDDLSKVARSKDCKRVSLEVRNESRAIAFYTKLHFSKVDYIPCYYQDGTDAIVMEKEL